MSTARLKDNIKLAETSIGGIFDFLNLLLEYFVFFRWIYFKNRPRGNFLLVRCLLALGVFGSLYFHFVGEFDLVLEGIQIDAAVALTIATIIGYWNMSNVFHRKSAYCSALEAEILKEYGIGNHKSADLLASSLSLHLLAVDLWAHRSFSKFFKRSLLDSIKYAVSKMPGQDAVHAEDKAIDKINKGKLSVRDARIYIENYLEHQIQQVRTT